MVHRLQDTHVDVAIIGAGWYGLSAAKTYLRLRPDLRIQIIDNDTSVGGVWSRDRLYPNLVAQVKLGLFNYSDAPMQPDSTHKDDRVSGEMIHAYLQRFAEDHDLIRRILFNTTVERAVRSGGGWDLHLADGMGVVHAGKVMVCTGVTSIPNLPAFDNSALSIPLLHSKDLGSSFQAVSDAKVKEVVVVGAAKSAYDAVYLLLSLGKQVTWLIRKNGAGPLAILPSMILGTVSSIAVASTRLMTFLSPSILNTDGFLYWALQRSNVGQWLVGTFWNVLATISDQHAGYGKGDHVAELRPEIDRQSTFWSNSGLGVVTMPKFWQTLHGPNLKIIRDTIVSAKGAQLTLESGQTLSSDALILCTGWGDHFGMFDDETKFDLGLPVEDSVIRQETQASHGPIIWDKFDLEADLTVNKKLPFLAKPPTFRPTHKMAGRQRHWRLYRRSIPIGPALRGDRSIAIMGQIHTVQTPLVAEIQCFWTILYLEGKIELPSPEVMAREIAEWNAWTRKRYLSQGQKFPYSLYDFLPYVDTLFGDLGLNSRRKKNPASELFEPYRAEDFKGFIEEYLRLHHK